MTFYDWENLPKIAKERFKLLSEAFWPGPLTIVAKKASSIEKHVTGGLNSVAVRIPNQNISLEILKSLTFPLAMPSANLSTRSY